MAGKKNETMNRYAKIIERIFLSRYKKGKREILFERHELVAAAEKLGLILPKNLGDLIYSFRYRIALPESVRSRAPKGEEWIIQPAGAARYRFVSIPLRPLAPNEMMAKIKVPDATPGIITMYALSDEQALLAKLRYNRLIDIFTGVTCYPLQSHLRTHVSNVGQVETDEVYIGLDQRGVHYVFPVQAKGAKDKLSVVQIGQDFELCKAKFPTLICHPIGAQFIESDLIAMFAFEQTETGVSIILEKHYRLVSAEELTSEELQKYRSQPSGDVIFK